MQLRLSSSLLLLSLAVVSAGAVAETMIEKLTLKPGESKAFSIEAQAKTKIGYRPKLTHDQAKQCKNNCIEISQVGGVTMASMYGATVGMKPHGGKIEWSLKNVESFPIEVEVFSK